MKLTEAMVIKAIQVKNPDKQPVLVASQFTGDDNENHKILKYDPVKKMYSFDGKRGKYGKHRNHFYMDRAITEFNLFELEE